MDRTINFAIIGCGRICSKHLEAIRDTENAKLIAVCDKVEERAKKIAEEFNCDCYTDYKEMLKREDIDIVNICTPNGVHPFFTMEVANAKKHILCEKPMALNLEEADKMIQSCKDNHVKLFVVKQNRYNPPILKMKEALDKGRFGKLLMGNITVRWSRPQEYYDNNEWHGTKSNDGGMLFTQASHHIDMLQWFMGPVQSVRAMTDTFTHKIETEDTAVAILRFKNGAFGVIEATTCTFPKNMEGSITILGKNGTAKIGGMAMNKIDHWEFADFQNDDATMKEVATFPSNVYGFGHKELIKNVVRNLLNTDTENGYTVDGEEGVKSIKIIRAIYKSAETGQEVVLD
ncbi:MAG: Gfo/Idh/MocA family oxidoreductase [Candidatus Woesearchaeota archaeon]